MILSKYYKKRKFRDNVNVVFNSLICDFVFLDDSEINALESLNLNDNYIKIYKNKGILVENETVDEEVLELFQSRFLEQAGKISVMYMILTNCCNLGCKYCFIENNLHNNNSNLFMSRDIIDSAISKFSSYIQSEKIDEPTIILYGGEPTFNKNIQYCINQIRKFIPNCKVTIVSNATMIDENLIRVFEENNVEVGISIDGPKSITDKNRVYKNSEQSVYDKVMESIRKLNASEVDYGLSITISHDVLDNQEEVIEWIKENKFPRIFYNLLHYSEPCVDWKEYYEKANKFLIKSHTELRKEGIFDGRIFRKINSLCSEEFKYADCAAAGANQIVIKPNGDICVCHAYSKTNDYVINKICDITLDELQTSSEFLDWKKRVTLFNEECLTCDSIFICGGGCGMQSEVLFGDRHAIDYPFCIHTKMLFSWLIDESYKSLNM